MSNLWLESKEGSYGDFLRWETPGATIEGYYLGMRDGKYGMVIDLDTDEGRRSVSATTMLVDKLTSIPVNFRVALTFRGFITTKNGRQLKDFQVLYYDPTLNVPYRGGLPEDDPWFDDSEAREGS